MSELYQILQNQADRRPDLQVDLLAAMRPLIRYLFEKEFNAFPDEIRRRFTVHHTGIMAGGSDRQTAMACPEKTAYENIPPVMLSARYKELLNREFYKRCFGKGLFAAIQRPSSVVFDSVEGTGNTGELYLFCSCPYIFIIDKKMLGDLPVPRRWEDLADPIYYKKICFNGTRYGPEPVELLFFYERFGYEGVDKICRNVIFTQHGSVMIRNLGTMRNKGAAVYLAPAFFAFCARGNERAEIVFPEDGIPFLPVYMTVKAGEEERCAPLTDLLRGDRITRSLTENGYPAADAKEFGIWEEHPLTWCPEELLLRPEGASILTKCRELFFQNDPMERERWRGDNISV